MNPQDLGRLEPYPIKERWPTEDKDFTPWLADAENLSLLGDTIGLSLTLIGMEQAVGPFYADIVCDAAGSDGEERRVVVENQYGRSDHDHLGKLLTYAAGNDAYAAVWIAETFTDEHRAALDWMNETSESQREFWALEIQLWQIGDSLPAPRFNVVAAPNPATRGTRDQSAELSVQRRERLEFWQGFHKYIEDHGVGITVSKPRPETYLNHTIGTTGISFGLLYTNYDLATQKNVDGETIVTRVELVLTGPLAFERYALLKQAQSDIETEVSNSVVWYEEAAKERKVFSQRLWGPDERSDREPLYEWLLSEVAQLESVLVPRLTS